jgi:hypothetical protein
VPLAAKAPVRHLYGRALTDEQAAIHKQLQGVSFAQQARLLADALRTGLVPLERPAVRAAFQALYAALRMAFGSEEEVA